MENRNKQRDMKDYEEKYIDTIAKFENYKVLYRRKKVLEVIDSFHAETILEIGCGLAPLFLYAKDKNFTIVEPSKQFYENAIKLSVNDSNVECIRGFFEECVDKLEIGKYDMIICSGLLNEVPDPNRLLKAIRMVGGKETILHVNVANAYSIHRLLGVEMGILRDAFDQTEGNKIMQQNTNFDMEMLHAIIEANGMCVIEDGSYFIKPFSHRQMWEMLEKKIINEDVLDGLYKLSQYMPQFGSEIYVNCRMKD